MPRLDEKALFDLARLATHRVIVEIEGVTQLIDNDHDSYAIYLAVTAALVIEATEIMRDGMEQQNGRSPDPCACKMYTLTKIASILGYDTLESVVTVHKTHTVQ